MDFLRNWALNIVVVAIFIVFLEILVPSGRVKKFTNLISGFILIIALINPVLGLLGKGIDIKDFQIADSNYINKQEIEKSSNVLKEEQMKQITEVYRKKLIGQMEECAKEFEGVEDAKADVIINEDYKSTYFGEIKRVYISLKLTGEKKDVKPVSTVKKVEIDKITENQTSDAPKQEYTGSSKIGVIEIDSRLKTDLENKISNLYSVSKENIVITPEGK